MSFATVCLLLAASAGSSSPPKTLREAAAAHKIEFWRAAVDPSFLSDPEYTKILSSEFSVVEPENATKFGPIHPRIGNEAASFDFTGADALAAYAKDHRMKFRGHTLVWHNQNPGWVAGLSSPELLSAMEGHINAVVGHFKGRAYAWDVVNEAFADNGSLRHTPWYDRPGIGLADAGTAYMEKAFRIARKADPRAKLFYNDYGAETLGAKADGIYAMAQDFKSRKVPLDGIGFQCHFIMPMNKPEVLDSIEKNFKRFADLGLDLHITELDIRIPNGEPASLQAQADFYEKFIALCVRQPRVRLIQTWGFTDKHSWIPGTFRGMGWALPWDESYSKKPAYDAILKALLGHA